ncbi:DNA polymerase IV [Clostridium sp. P21]|uniref:DNA polymerase IV n=1 Tax=Clostridium muellerianum TaxID=2716538 RepID=A0A7Y0EFY0_9CLOT|nr:DNA polymerase IV [Clostridium muellerianum]NMM62676.1 DNA polymerase IV [Clostridium muellerianum]
MTDRIVFHIDVNSAFLSWSAVYKLSQGEKVDLREIPSIIGGDETKRHGIVLAKSISAKKYGIKTGEPIAKAKRKCTNILVVPPLFTIYSKYSKSMFNLLKEYTPDIQKFSIDECFLDLTGEKDYINLAHIIKDRIKKELGFTVNIGISNNKLLAKMASDFEKPDKIHTLFPEEIKDKMWPLPVEDLFMVGRATLPKLNSINIYTIGDLANYDLSFLKYKFKSYGELLWNYANGIDNSKLESINRNSAKSISNSTTLTYDVTNREAAHKIILSLCENITMKLRSNKFLCSVIAVSIKNSSFEVYSKQKKVTPATDCTDEIVEYSFELFDTLWKGEPIRLIGVTLGDLCKEGIKQLSLFDDENYEKSLEKNRSLDKALDNIKNKFGTGSIFRLSSLDKD